MKTLLFRPLPLARFALLSAAAAATGGFLTLPNAHAQTEAAPPASAPSTFDRDAVRESSSLFQAINAYGKAEQSQKSEDYAAAFTKMQQAIAEYPENSVANAWYGYLLLTLQKEPEKAIPYLEKAISLNPKLPSPYTNLGSAIFAKPSHTLEETDRAVQAFQTAAQLSLTAAQSADPAKKAELTAQAGGAYFDLGYALSKAGRYDEAVTAYRKSLELRPDDGKTYSNMGLALQRLNKNKDDEAIAALKKGVAYNPLDAASWSLLGMMQAQIVSRTGVQPTAKDAPGAINSLETALKREPNNYNAQTTLALMYALVGRDADAAAAYSTAAAMAEASTEPSTKQDLLGLYYNRAVVLARREKYAEASLAYEQALSVSPTYYDALVGDAYALTKQNKTEAAIARYRAAANQAKTPKQQLIVWNNLVVAYDKKKDAKNADYARRKVAVLDPGKVALDTKTADYWNQKGLEYQLKGNLEAAFRAYQTALTYPPSSAKSYAVSHNNVGVIYEKRYQLNLAVKEYKKALAIDPKMQVARANLARFTPSGLLTPKNSPLPKFAQPGYRTL